jgi:RuvC endonuclease subdomain 3
VSEIRGISYTLGLDLGVSSLGWALLDSANRSFVAAGVRIFDSGMDEKKFEKGEQGASNNAARRAARLHRRQLRRRAARQREFFITLQNAGLLPLEPRGGSPEARHVLIEDLDRMLTAYWAERIQTASPSVVAPQHVLPYFLRARALDNPLEPFELGRALYHLGQRRGYRSNRREGRKLQDENKGKKKQPSAEDEDKRVLAEIAGLETDFVASGARTLGEFLSRRDPAFARIRTLHTTRKMFEDEFTLRKAWGLNSLLPGKKKDDNSEKRRGDHRHHAIDAMVIALSSQSAIQQLSVAAASADGRIVGRISSRPILPPWTGFVDSLRPVIDSMNVSHRPDHKLNGAFHDETNYGWRKDGNKDCARIREPITKAAGHPDRIADPKVREAVNKKLEQVGGKAEKLKDDWPTLVTRTGKVVPIKKVRVNVKRKPQEIAEGSRRRYVALNANHHVCIFETKDRDGKLVWNSPGVLSRYEALQRKRRREPIVQRRLSGDEGRFLFSLMNNDNVEMNDVRSARGLFVVRGISDGEIDFVRLAEARRKEEFKKTSDLTGDFVRVKNIDRLREWNCRKVVVDVLGCVRYAND